jgi:uncharacterized protein GlcG (DUF336 family)
LIRLYRLIQLYALLYVFSVDDTAFALREQVYNYQNDSAPFQKRGVVRISQILYTCNNDHAEMVSGNVVLPPHEGAVVSISIEIARRIMEGCKQRAQELRSPVSIAIVDAGGHLVVFERMMAPYGWATGNISLAKACTAVMFNQSTDAIAQWGSGIPGFASSMAAMTQGKFIMAAGGWPIRMGGTTIGGIGISGGNAPGRDDDIARAGLAAITQAPAATFYHPPQQPSLQPTPAYPSMPAPMPAPAPAPAPASAAAPGIASMPQSVNSMYLGNEHESSPDDEQFPFEEYHEPDGGQS